MEKELNVKLCDYVLVRKVGAGSFGEVYEARDCRDRRLAVKRLRLRRNISATIAELRVVDLVPKHDNIIDVRGYFFHPEKPMVYIVMEFCETGDLNDYVIIFDPELEELLGFAIDMAKGLKHLHEHKVIHRDVKPHNVLIAKIMGKNICKICDFNVSKIQDGNQYFQSMKGSLFFAAPEVIDMKNYTFSADLYSLGLVFYVIFTGMVHTNSSGRELAPWILLKSEFQLLTTALREGIDRRKFIRSYFMDVLDLGELILTMVSLEPAQRPTLDEIIASLENFRISFGDEIKATLMKNTGSIRRDVLADPEQGASQADSGLGSLDRDSSGGVIPAVNMRTMSLRGPGVLEQPLAGSDSDDLEELSVEECDAKQRKRRSRSTSPGRGPSRQPMVFPAKAWTGQ